MDKEKSFVLSNGLSIPAIGYGTGIANGYSKLSKSQLLVKLAVEKARNIVHGYTSSKNSNYSVKKDLKKDRSLREVTEAAVNLGCRLFDTARAYMFSEEYLGDSVVRSGIIPRDELFIITKATNRAQSNDAILRDFEESLKNLGTDYIDLYLLHWPQAGTYLTQWKVMERLYKEGAVKAIGICNSHIHHLEALREVCEIMPMADELECHPALPQNEIRTYCKENGIQLIAHTPTGKHRYVDEKIKEIAKAKNVSPTQIILRWHFQLGDVSIPNTTSVDHLKENLNIWDFSLSDEEMVVINAVVNRVGGASYLAESRLLRFHPLVKRNLLFGGV